MVDGLNFQGHDLKGVAMTRPKDCYGACLAHAPNCRAFTFIKDSSRTAMRCWLKREGYQTAGWMTGGTISGVLSPRDRLMKKGRRSR